MNTKLTKEEVLKKWKPVLEKLNIDSEKLQLFSEYAELHAIQSITIPSYLDDLEEFQKSIENFQGPILKLPDVKKIK